MRRLCEAVRAIVTDEVWSRTKAIVRDALEAQREADQRDAEVVRALAAKKVALIKRRPSGLTEGFARPRPRTR